ncbi:MAG: hypothetical protein Q9169_006645 [Polycauliona sp. 2 TL-2023]
MLGVALLPTGDILWFKPHAFIPALCYFRRLGSKDPDNRFQVGSWTGASMAVSLVVLVSGFLIRIFRFSEKSSSSIRYYLRQIPSRNFKRIRGDLVNHLTDPGPYILKLHWIVVYIILETLYVWMKALFDIYESLIFEILWLLGALIWGTKNLLTTRSSANNDDENTWEFGQMFPVILLVLPLLSALETYYEQDLSIRQSNLPDEASESGFSDESSPVQTHQRKQQLALFIGHWQPTTQSELRAGSATLDNVRTISRTGTDLQNEEQVVGGLHSRQSPTPTQSGPTTCDPSLGETSTSGERRGPDSTLDYYQLHWYWIVVLTIVSGATVADFTFRWADK